MIAIIDYNAGNTRSVMNALSRLEADYILTRNKEEILRADRVILPGVGHARAAMDKLHEYDLVDTIKSVHSPFLGICLGMQIMLDRSEEGDTDCLGIVPGTVKAFPRSKEKVPHMGWNSIQYGESGELYVPENPEFYFVHSYYVPLLPETLSESNYIIPFSASIHSGNFYGVQFHPEKSSKAGAELLAKFLMI